MSWFCAGLLKGIGEGRAVLQPLSVTSWYPGRYKKTAGVCGSVGLRWLQCPQEISPGAPAANANSLEKSCCDSLKGGSARECSDFLLGFLQGVGGFRHQRSCLCPGKLQIQHFAKRSVLKDALLELAFFGEAKYLIFLRRSFPSGRYRIPKKEFDIN